MLDPTSSYSYSTHHTNNHLHSLPSQTKVISISSNKTFLLEPPVQISPHLHVHAPSMQSMRQHPQHRAFCRHRPTHGCDAAALLASPLLPPITHSAHTWCLLNTAAGQHTSTDRVSIQQQQQQSRHRKCPSPLQTCCRCRAESWAHAQTAFTSAALTGPLKANPMALQDEGVLDGCVVDVAGRTESWAVAPWRSFCCV